MNITALKHAALAAMPLSLAKQYTRLFNRQRYQKEFKKWGSGGGAAPFRIYVPVGAGKHSIPNQMYKPDSDITDFLHARGYFIDNYLLGTAINPKTKKTAMVADLLKDMPRLAAKFETDPQRASAELFKEASLVVISRHPYDIAGVSFGRPWSEWSYGDKEEDLKEAIRNGTLVAYHVKATDRNINRPTGHVLLRAFRKYGSHGSNAPVVLDVDWDAATSHVGLAAVARTFVKKYNRTQPEGVYYRVLANGKNQALVLRNGHIDVLGLTYNYNHGKLSEDDIAVLQSYNFPYTRDDRIPQ